MNARTRLQVATLLVAFAVSLHARPARSVLAHPTRMAPVTDRQRETVVLLHGVALHAVFMAPLASRLRAAGFDVVNLTYPSRTVPLDALGDTWLPEALERHVPDGRRVCFVTHSMGGLVLRRYAATHGTDLIGRVVMIAPPNQGSESADHLLGSALVRWFIGCNLATLRTAPGSACHTLPAGMGGEVQAGIIAGDRWINPLSRDALPSPHDGSVSVASTHLDGERDHVVLHASHTGLPFRRATARQVIAFLGEGHFDHAAAM